MAEVPWLRLSIPYFEMMYSKEKNQETILAIVLGLLVIQLFTGYKNLIIISVVLLAIPIFSMTVAGWITWAWLKLSHVMGYVMSKLILSVIFFLVLFPVSLAFRVFGKSGLQLNKSDNDTYYSQRDHTYVPSDFEDPW